MYEYNPLGNLLPPPPPTPQIPFALQFLVYHFALNLTGMAHYTTAFFFPYRQRGVFIL